MFNYASNKYLRGIEFAVGWANGDALRMDTEDQGDGGNDVY